MSRHANVQRQGFMDASLNWPLLAAKIAAAIAIVVTASGATERAGPRVGAMIATLPSPCIERLNRSD